MNKLIDRGLSADKIRDLIMDVALTGNGGNVAQAARSMGLTRAQVAYWAEKHGIT